MTAQTRCDICGKNSFDHLGVAHLLENDYITRGDNQLIYHTVHEAEERTVDLNAGRDWKEKPTGSGKPRKVMTTPEIAERMDEVAR